MGLFDFLREKRVEQTEKQLKLNKLWELWEEEKAASPYAELMTYQSEVNNGGHSQYFTNVSKTKDLQKEMLSLEAVLPTSFKRTLQRAYRAYLSLEESDNEKAEGILEQCDEMFYESEEEINCILEEYAAKIEL